MTHDDPRFPIGPFQSLGRPLTPAERADFIGHIEAHPTRLRAAVDDLNDEQLDTRYRDGGWTVRQVVHHVVDSHMNAYIRFKLAATEDGPRISTYDEAAWAEFAHSKEAPIAGSLALLTALHARWVAFLRELPASAFTRPVDHPEIGHITMDVLLEIYGWHTRHHEAHVTALRARKGW